MVKAIAIVSMLISILICSGQNLSMGVGARANINWVESREEFNFDILNSIGDTLKLTTTGAGVELLNGLSFPIYARYTSKRNWWAQLNYGYEVWRLGINASTKPTDYAIQTKINELGLESTEELTEAFEDDATVKLESFERVQYNKLSFAIGSSINKKGIVTFYYGAGFDFYTTSTIETYQGLIYDNNEVELQYQVLADLPKLETNIFSPFVNFGIEKQNIRLGLDLSFYPGPAFGQHQPENNLTTLPNLVNSQLIKNIKAVGVSLNYTLFNQNFNQAISADKKNVLDPLVIGKYRQKPKLIQYGISLNFPSFRNNGWSVIDAFELENENDIVFYNDSLKDKNDTYLSGRLFQYDLTQDAQEILDYIYIEKQDETTFINESGAVDTVFISTLIFLDWGEINSIVKSPKVSAFVRLNPHELFSTELNVGYQNHTYGIVAYESVNKTIDGETRSQTRKLVYQENFHELSFGLNVYTQKQINNISQIGFHIGLNYNVWFNGIFQREPGGINDSELLEDFHDYNVGDDEEAEEWNANINADADKGVFTKKNYYDYKYNGQNAEASYHLDYSPYRFNSFQKRNYFEFRMGLDYYIENLKFNLYAERSILRNETMYSSLLSVGMGVSLFLN